MVPNPIQDQTPGCSLEERDEGRRHRPVTLHPVTGPAGSDDREDEQLLVERARTDPTAFAELYRIYLPKIHAFAYRRSRSREVAEDVTAATFERAYRQLDKFEWRGGGGFQAWLFRIASNELNDHFRKIQRATSERGQVAMGALFTPSTVDDVGRIEGGGEAARVIAALEKINPRYQEAISLRYFSDLSHEDAAAAMGVSKPVMAVTLTRATKALKKAMEKMEQESGREVS